MRFVICFSLHFLFFLLILNLPVNGQLVIPRHISNGMVLQRESEFKIQGWVEAKIAENKIIVSGKEVPHPVAVRYDWTDNPKGADLFNKEGLPASAFSTNMWTIELTNNQINFSYHKFIIK